MSTRTRPMAFGIYLHSDTVTQNKGADLVAATSQEFASMAARLAFGSAAQGWEAVADTFPHAEQARSEQDASVHAVASIALSRGQAGRIDAVSGPDLAVAVKVLSATDFAAKTDAFRAFTPRRSARVVASADAADAMR